MTYRIAINGYGRIGRSVLRALYESRYYRDLKIVAINELSETKTIAHLTKYDTTHGRFSGSVEMVDNHLYVNNDYIYVFHEPDIERLPWSELGIDVVLECTGFYKSRSDAEKHIQQGAKKVLFSNPAEKEVDATVIYGINDHLLTVDHRILSNASCTTNCIIPIIDILQTELGIDYGTITTIHSMMNDQPVIDAYHHRSLRQTRCAGQSIIPVDTELSRGIARIFPELSGRFEAVSLRVPTINVSAMDMSVVVKKNTDSQTVNRLIVDHIKGKLKEVVGFTEEPLASCDFNHDYRSSVVDGNQTRVSGKRLVKILAWFDNEWGYANRMLDTTYALMQVYCQSIS